MDIPDMIAELEGLQKQWAEEEAGRVYAVDFSRLHAEAVEWVNYASPLTIAQRTEALDAMREVEGLPPFDWSPIKNQQHNRKIP